MRNIIAWDIDNTICFGNNDDSIIKCEQCKPILKSIEMIKRLKEKGFKIILFTARGVNLSEITLEWLKKYDVPFDKVIFNKPRWDMLVDDRALNVLNVDSIDDIFKAIIKSKENEK